MSKYDIVISDILVDSFLDVLFFLLTAILSELREKPRKDWVTEKKNIEEFVWGASLFLTAHPFLCHFLLLPLSSPFPFLLDVLAEWPLKKYIILRWLVFCVMVLCVNGQKYDNLLQFNTHWLASLGTWYYFSLCFSFSCSGYGLT